MLPSPHHCTNLFYSPLQLKLDSESFPTWFGLPTPAFTATQYRVAYLRSWAPAGRSSRASRNGTTPPPGDTTTPYVILAAALPTDTGVSPYELGRAPSPGAVDPTAAAGRVAAVPRTGWGAYRVRRGLSEGKGGRGGLKDLPPVGVGVPRAGGGGGVGDLPPVPADGGVPSAQPAWPPWVPTGAPTRVTTPAVSAPGELPEVAAPTADAELPTTLGAENGTLFPGAP